MNKSVDVGEISPTKINEDLIQLDTIFEETRARRLRIIEKLEPLVMGLTVKTTEARETEVQMLIVKTYLDVLRDDESGILKRVGSKLKLAEQETVSKHSANVVEFLSKLSSKQIHFGSGDSADLASPHDETALNEAFSSAGLEPIKDTELKTDPNDVAP